MYLFHVPAHQKITPLCLCVRRVVLCTIPYQRYAFSLHKRFKCFPCVFHFFPLLGEGNFQALQLRTIPLGMGKNLPVIATCQCKRLPYFLLLGVRFGKGYRSVRQFLPRLIHHCAYAGWRE